MLLYVILILLAALFVPPLIYFTWMKNMAKKNWDLIIDNNYQPKVSMIIPTYNESLVIRKKLENIQKMDYPNDKLQIILVDSASNDNTLVACKDFLEKNDLGFTTILISEEERRGKSHALNTALRNAGGEIIATSDADSFWEPDALRKAVSFFADPSIGAVTGREELLNLDETIHTLSEGIYRRFYNTLRLGESKLHSTPIVDGGLLLYRRSAFDKFETRAGHSDDIGTVVNILSKRYRCIHVHEAVFHDKTAYSFRGRMMLKSRRALHLISGITHSVRLKAQKNLSTPSIIILFNFYLHVISPLILISAIFITTIYIFSSHLNMFFYLLSIVLIILALEKPRTFIVSYITSNLALVNGLRLYLVGKKEAAWPKVKEMRT